MRETTYYARNVIVATAGLIAAWLFAQLVLTPFLWSLIRRQITPVVGTSMTRWYASYLETVSLALYAPAVAALLWLFGALIGTGRRGDGSAWWVLLGTVAVAGAFLVGFSSLEPATSGRPLAVFSVAVIGGLSYWLGTWLTSPDTYKYTPWGAVSCRSRLPW